VVRGGWLRVVELLKVHHFRYGGAVVEALFLCAMASLVVGWFGRNRKFGFWGYFFCSLALTPIVGVIILLASDAKKLEDHDNAASATHSSS